VQALRAAFPKVKVRVQLDGGFACPEMFTFLEKERIENVIARAKNSVLEALAEPMMKEARLLSKASQQTEHVYGEASLRPGHDQSRGSARDGAADGATRLPLRRGRAALSAVSLTASTLA
jgi:hypothetical protein